jgi:DNA-binding CsgD family transcriptional regulator
MLRLSSEVLLRAHRFLLEIHAAGSVDGLRRTIPEGLARLISADRISLNELEVGPERKAVAPTPVPTWWSRLGDVYEEHLMEHPLWNGQDGVRLNRIISFHDRDCAGTWHRSTLYNEYFVPSGMKHQLATLIFGRGTAYVGIGVNRSSRRLSAIDRALFGLLGPHLSQAWKTSLALTEFKQHVAEYKQTAPKCTAMITVDRAQGKMRNLCPDAAIILQAHFGTRSAFGDRLPEAMQRWLRTQQLRLRVNGDLLQEPFEPLQIHDGSGSLVARVASYSPAEFVILLKHGAHSPVQRSPAFPKLTPREVEVLKWLAEGKRNGEIGIILGTSGRTVGKHVEHILAKLGVETRTAAARESVATGYQATESLRNGGVALSVPKLSPSLAKYFSP